MQNCMLCGTPTNGSIGVAGMKWSKICQPCKDAEDQAYARQLNGVVKFFDVLFNTTKQGGIKW